MQNMRRYWRSDELIFTSSVHGLAMVSMLVLNSGYIIILVLVEIAVLVLYTLYVYDYD